MTSNHTQKTTHMNDIENRTFDEIRIGDSASLTRMLTEKDLEHFAVICRDLNPLHVDAKYTKNELFHKIIAQGMWGPSLLSTLLSTELPGPGTLYLEQALHHKHPMSLGDEVTVTVTVSHKIPKHH